ncbi:MAG: tetratricopeptide repeat protein [Candidatus Lokiarchaeia archaeon]
MKERGEEMAERQLDIGEMIGDAEIHNKLGLALAEKWLLDKAIQEFRKAIRINPDHAEAHYDLGLALADKGLMNEAIQEYREAIKTKQNHIGAHYKLGVGLDSVGDLDGAAEAYHNFLKFSAFRSFIESMAFELSPPGMRRILRHKQQQKTSQQIILLEMRACKRIGEIKFGKRKKHDERRENILFRIICSIKFNSKNSVDTGFTS